MSTQKDQKLTATDLSNFSVTLKPEAITLRDSLIGESGFIETVKTKAEMTEAIAIVGKLKGFNAEIEKTRKAIKEPVLEAGRLIEATAHEACCYPKLEVSRIEKLISDFQREEMRKAEELRLAELRKQQESERIERDRLAAEQRAIDAANKLAKESQDAEIRRQADIEAKRLEDERFERQFDAQPIAQPLTVIETRAEGAKTTKKYVFEVTDIRKFYAAMPDYVELTIKRADLNARLNMPNPGLDIFSIPGLDVKEETKVSVKAVKLGI